MVISDFISERILEIIDGCNELSLICSSEENLADPRGSQKGLISSEKALGQRCMRRSYQAFAQNETVLGQALLRKAIRLDRSILDGQAGKYFEFLVQTSIKDGHEHEPALRRVFEQLPPELAWMRPSCEAVIARGYLHRGVHSIIRGRPDEGQTLLNQAAALGGQLDPPFWLALFGKIDDYEVEFGSEAASKAFQHLTKCLRKIGAPKDVRRFSGLYYINRAFRHYHRGQRKTVSKDIFRAVSSNPAHLANRGVLSMLFRSLITRRY